jgi:hypothetical protein
LLNGSHTSVGDVETQGLIERGTICLFEQLRQVTQHRERLNDFVEREWLGSWGSGREYGFCGSLKGPRTRRGKACGTSWEGQLSARVSAWLAGKRAAMLGRRSSAERSRKRRSAAVKVAGRDLGSGGAVVLVDDAAEDVTASDSAASRSGDRVGDRLGEPQAAMRPRLVVVANVLVEHGFEMSS